MENSKKTNKQNPDSSQATTYRRTGILLVCILLICAAIYLDCNRHQTGQSGPRRQKDPNTYLPNQINWAKRLELPGLPNFYKVSDKLYRGAQPTAEGMRQLKELGIKTVVNLRFMHSDRDELGETGLAYKHIRMTTWDSQTEDAARFLRIITDSNCTPVFVHCQYGSDRTGTMCAIYRIAVQGWSKNQAIEEMTNGGFGFHRIWKNLVNYVRDLDIEQLKQNAGLNE